MGEAGRGKGPARVEGETPGTWNPEQGCLEVETKRVLELGSLSTVLIKLARGKVHVVGTDEVEQPELTITERIYAGSKSEAAGFYKKNGSGVGVKVDSDTLSVTEKNSSGVVSGGSGNVQIEGRSGDVVIVRSTIGGNIVNNNTGHGKVIIDGRQIGPSQSAPRRETQVVLKVPVAESVSEGKKPKPEYIIEVGAGNVTVENTTGEYDVSVSVGNTVFKECDIVRSRVTNTAGNIEVIDGVFIGKNNTFKTEAGNISVKFGRGQGEIEVQTSSGSGAIRRTQSFFEGVKNPDGQTAILRLTAKAGKIEVNE